MAKYEDSDLAFALALQQKYDNEIPSQDHGNSCLSKTSGHLNPSCSKSLVDSKWELYDPTPNIHVLFAEFNKTFFWNALTMVEVRWSPRMTLCAGICCYEGHGGLCSVRLSEPLLKLRPRKDLVETLLHEMIHAYLFVTDNNKDHDGHGPEFCRHMNRINTEAGTNITIYHNFHDEVDEMRKHWWRCTGRCRTEPPYYGYVKRAMNRAPSSNDFWWAEHQRTCGGNYIKIKEPEDYGKKKRKTGEKPSTSKRGVDPPQKTLGFPTLQRNSQDVGHVIGGTIAPLQRNGRGIPTNSRLLKLTNKNALSQRNPLIASPLKEVANSPFVTQRWGKSSQVGAPSKVTEQMRRKKPESNLAMVCKEFRRGSSQSVNSFATAYHRYKVITKFLTTKEQKSRICFSSDDEFSDSEPDSVHDVEATETSYSKDNDREMDFGGDLDVMSSSCDEPSSSSRSSKSVGVASSADIVSENKLKRKLSANSSSIYRSPAKKKTSLIAPCDAANNATANSTYSSGISQIDLTADDGNIASSILSFCKSTSHNELSDSSDDEDDVLISTITDVDNTPASSLTNNEKHSYKSLNAEEHLNANAETIQSWTSDNSDSSPVIGHNSLSLPSKVACPICNELILSRIINSHVDNCLSVKAIRDSLF